MKKNKKKMDTLVTKFVEKFTNKINELLSDQDAQIGNRIALKRLRKCKSRLTKACCPLSTENDPGEHEMLFHFGDEWNDYVDSPPALPMIDDDTALPILPLLGGDGGKEQAFLSNMLSHLYNMQTLVDNTLMRNLKDVFTPPPQMIKRASLCSGRDIKDTENDVENPLMSDESIENVVDNPIFDIESSKNDIDSQIFDIESSKNDVENSIFDIENTKANVKTIQKDENGDDQNYVENSETDIEEEGQFDVESNNFDIENPKSDVESCDSYDIENNQFDVGNAKHGDDQNDIDDGFCTMDEKTGDDLV